MDEIKELQKGISDILVAIGKLETEMRHLSSMSGKLDYTEKVANEALQSTRSAHKRLDDMAKEIEALKKKYDDDKKHNKDDKKWLIGTGLAAAALIWNFIKGGIGQ
ncbi:hypothetical protein [Brevibacillus sp. DP1.3A]|uniref:hypothetical protein n=1 Tax=Brevibacillus sp. DP1.3A TaxID=2738867 RepID=UPI00156B4AF2|nr:hypothetical protein [Brevibacillus sp. DP1.3A]UED78064.1 hypothetical protein HP399_030890 [Brevibacillus sp. DP1.3A]